MVLVKIINEVSDIFEEHGYKIYAVGGTVRDFLLEREIHDYDFVTDATPEEMKLFLDTYKDVFAKYGVMIYKHKGIKIEITTLRKESSYNDSRHPEKIKFVKHLKECSDCMEETTIQFLATEGLNRLEEGTTFDLDKELNDKLVSALRREELRQRFRFLLIGVEIISIIIIIFVFIYVFFV